MELPAGHRLELPFHLVDHNREVFVVIFILAGDLVGIVCFIGKRVYFLDMCILLTLNAAYCPLEHMEVR